MPKAIPKFSAFKRVIALCIASILLHLVAFDWATEHVHGFDARQDEPPPIMVQLQAISMPLAQQTAASTVPLSQAPKPVRKRRARPGAMMAAPAAIPGEMAASDSTVDNTAAALSDAPEAVRPVAEPEQSAAVVETGPAPPASESAAPAKVAVDLPAAPPVPHYKVSPPPSAELKYDVVGLRDGKTVYGSAKILWQYAGDTYSIKGETSVLFFTLLAFGSEGSIDGFGVAPLLYAEKRMRKSETNTHFHRERNTISFSASTLSYPRQGGEQDRASILWQLAGIARGDSGKFVAGKEIDVFVAGVRDGEVWRIQIIGQEQIELGREKIDTWHVQRQPRPGSYEQKLDIWLAPQQEWYPVRIAYTEVNGDKLDMSLSGLDILRPPPP